MSMRDAERYRERHGLYRDRAKPVEPALPEPVAEVPTETPAPSAQPEVRPGYIAAGLIKREARMGLVERWTGAVWRKRLSVMCGLSDEVLAVPIGGRAPAGKQDPRLVPVADVAALIDRIDPKDRRPAVSGLLVAMVERASETLEPMAVVAPAATETVAEKPAPKRLRKPKGA
jgi:hypothetical protein